jgi:hypothetical protein
MIKRNQLGSDIIIEKLGQRVPAEKPSKTRHNTSKRLVQQDLTLHVDGFTSPIGICYVWHDRWNWRSMDWTYLGGSSDRKFIAILQSLYSLMAAFRYSLELRTTEYTE